VTLTFFPSSLLGEYEIFFFKKRAASASFFRHELLLLLFWVPRPDMDKYSDNPPPYEDVHTSELVEEAVAVGGMNFSPLSA
jgi:hypothetical protein